MAVVANNMWDLVVLDILHLSQITPLYKLSPFIDLYLVIDIRHFVDYARNVSLIGLCAWGFGMA
jgi:hypothetical protein